ncbi:MAG TPA: DNA polymerase III subunit delta' [Alphaproteobacteria bacterium]|nr:DNA polymerase III subunit delta' [Alphaproteobacteria bacterium]
MASLFADEETDDVFDDPDIDSIVDAAAPAVAEEVTPRTNPDCLGHEAIEKMLLADFTAGRMPHAIVLSGAPGIGKATLAYRLARFLLSQSEEDGASLFGDAAPPETLYVAPDQPVFRRVASGGHADLMTVEREFDEKRGRLKNDISVESVRRIHPFLRKTAAEGGWRVVIVDSAEHLNQSSQNALLKILEEPPKKTVLILTTAQPGGFLPTIRSRCRMIPMEGLSDDVMHTLLDKCAPGLPPAQKSMLITLSEGSLGRALQFHEDGGIALYQDLLQAAATLPELDLVLVHELAEKIGKFGAERSFGTACDILTGWCERVTRLQARGLPIDDVLPGDAAVFQRLTGIYPPQHFLATWEKLTKLFYQTDSYNLDKRQALITSFLMLQNPDHPGLNI